MVAPGRLKASLEQMLEVAFARRMLFAGLEVRVWQVRPSASTVWPASLPGIWRR